MQNCPLEATKIASVMALNAQNRKTYALNPAWGVPSTPLDPQLQERLSCRSVPLSLLIPKTATAKSAWIKACLYDILMTYNY